MPTGPWRLAVWWPVESLQPMVWLFLLREPGPWLSPVIAGPTALSCATATATLLTPMEKALALYTIHWEIYRLARTAIERPIILAGFMIFVLLLLLLRPLILNRQLEA